MTVPTEGQYLRLQMKVWGMRWCNVLLKTHGTRCGDVQPVQVLPVKNSFYLGSNFHAVIISFGANLKLSFPGCQKNNR